MGTKTRPGQKGEPMDRQTLLKYYEALFDQAEEKSAEWYASGTIAAALAGTEPISQARKRLEEERDQC
jgi:O-acetyl-ADP-ribose deacetylase (regulator of RNase III)